MKRKLINKIIKDLAINKDFLPLLDEDGKLYYGNNARIIMKNTMGTFVAVELIDGDMMTSSEIEQYMNNSKIRLNNINEASYHYIIEVFLFNNATDEEKINKISEGQTRGGIKKKYLKSVIVDINSKKVDKCFKMPLFCFGVDNAIRNILNMESNWEDYENKQSEASENEKIDVFADNYNSDEFNINEILSQKENEMEFKLKASKPVITFLLIAVNVIVWALTNIYAAKSGKDINELQNLLGAKDNARIINGEIYRLIAPIFLHANLEHLVYNSLALYMVGINCERIFGHLKFTGIYFISGIIGYIASFMFTPNMAVGASGAIMGLFGAMLYFGILRPKIFARYFAVNVIVIVVMTLLNGFTKSGIDNYAHIGGLIGGFLAAGVLEYSGKKKWYLNRVLYIVLSVITIIGGFAYGITNNQNHSAVMMAQMSKLHDEKNWVKLEQVGEELLAMKLDVDSKRTALWEVAVAENMQEKNDEGIKHADELIPIAPPDGHYLKGLILIYMNRYEDSKKELLEAKRLGAKYKNIDELVGQIDSQMNRN
ncbi:MAG: rhomboid family intramembrane serine protease [Bacillota bacterium]|nr:rhomboid family intramembrane serine protease [Bacillota bacterium]